MLIDREQLPDDIPALKGIIFHLRDVIEEQRRQIERLTHRVETLERQLYGRRSERRASSSSGQGARQTGHGRRRLPEDLPRQCQAYDLSTSERICSHCGGFLSRMGDVSCEQLDSTPSRLYVIEHRRAKYACRRCQEKVVGAKMPLQPIDKGLAGSGLLAEVLVNKYQDHLPLYRQSQRFKRVGMTLSRSTLGGWVIASADLLSPLVRRMYQSNLLLCGHLFSDDTPVRVLERLEGEARTGRFWIYTNKGRKDFPACTVYAYTPHRKGEGPLKFLNAFEGYLQADAFSGFDKLYESKEGKTRVIEVACWAHARRYFYECALETPPESLAHQGLAFIQELYDIERSAKERNLCVGEIKRWRSLRAPPVLKRFHTWLEDNQKRVLPKSSLAGAMAYALNHWKALNTYVQEGYLEIDNNRAERGIRPLAVGRKNYLFVGNTRGGQAAFIIYSLIETCKQHHVNPWLYFKDVLSRLSTHPYSKIDDLLPYYWKPLPENTALKVPIKIAA